MKGLRIRFQRLWRQSEIRLPRHKPKNLKTGDRLQLVGCLFQVQDQQPGRSTSDSKQVWRLKPCGPDPPGAGLGAAYLVHVGNQGLDLEMPTGSAIHVPWEDALVFNCREDPPRP